jgi:putative two-component system response regulator
LRGNEIPLEGRIMAIADVYDALVSARPYKKAIPHEDAVKIIIEGKNTQFDPVLIELFESVSHRFR